MEHGTLLCKITPETARCVLDRDKVLVVLKQSFEEDMDRAHVFGEI
jgi:hypothetical protein